MASLISQMRNGQMQQTPPQLQIEPIKQLMNMVRMSANPQAALANINPYFGQLLQNPNLKGMAQQMAKERGIDLNQLVANLMA